MPAYDPAAGPLGLQGRHQWNGGFILNHLEGGLPYADLDTITGLFSLPEADDSRDPRIGANGEVVYPTFTRGKTVTYEGRIITVDESIYAYRWAMLGAFADQNNEGTMTITPHPSWGGGGWQFQARVLTLDIDDDIIVDALTARPSPFELHFILSLRMHNNDFTQV